MPQIEEMNRETPDAAWESSDPTLWMRCDALEGCWMTHQMTKAISSHFTTDFIFTAASSGAQT
jgi:hypothetical protein